MNLFTCTDTKPRHPMRLRTELCLHVNTAAHLKYLKRCTTKLLKSKSLHEQVCVLIFQPATSLSTPSSAAGSCFQQKSFKNPQFTLPAEQFTRQTRSAQSRCTQRRIQLLNSPILPSGGFMEI